MRASGILSLLTAVACGGRAEQSAPADRVVAPVDLLHTTITLARMACLGPCPIYSIRVDGSGAVTYQGDDFVRVRGPASRQIAASEAEGLVNEFEQADYWRLSVPQCLVIDDASSAITSMTRDQTTHKIDHNLSNHCAPAVLDTLERHVDEVTGSADWVSCATPDGTCETP